MEMSLEAREDADFAWEWPTRAIKGWSSKVIRRLLRVMKKLGRPVYWCRFHGCAYGLEYKGIFQQPNLTQVQAAAPTMSRVSRNMLLCLAANCGFKLRSGDVTSAFLQAKKSLEQEDLIVWAPPELAVLYGADPAGSMWSD